ncbi:MAG: phytanoyl-CoA dioxygenase family protein [Actinomycetota bacterium]|jgi:ectoine hydroxylase-related dioxygenase (phytanoyl-CoA dioxygenase family)|nr:phytanoyl-CoA dioxygenase family protein [Actinomycetota bacterium]
MDTGQDNPLGAIDRNPFSPEAMAVAARFLSTEADRAEVSDAITALARDGYCVIENALDAEQLAAARDEVDRLNAETPPSASSFGGYDTRRAFNLLGRSRAFDPLAAHPKVIAAVEAHLDDQIQLSETSTITLESGQGTQVLHHDDGCYPVPRPHMPLMISAMWAIDDFTAANGATRVVPGSHLVTEVDTAAATLPLEMPAGSVGLWDGRLVHGGGANTTGAPRRGLAVLYARAWLRQQENQYLCLAPEVVAGFDRRLQRLLGWCLYGPHTGIVQGRDPKHLLV